MIIKEKPLNQNQTTVKDLADLLKKTADALEVYQRANAIAPAYIAISEMPNVIKRARKEQKVSREVLAKLAGVSIGTLGAIEAGKDTVSLSNIQKVLQALGKSLWIR